MAKTKNITQTTKKIATRIFVYTDPFTNIDPNTAKIH